MPYIKKNHRSEKRTNSINLRFTETELELLDWCANNFKAWPWSKGKVSRSDMIIQALKNALQRGDCEPNHELLNRLNK